MADLPPKSREKGDFFVIFRVGEYSKNIADSLNEAR